MHVSSKMLTALIGVLWKRARISVPRFAGESEEVERRESLGENGIIDEAGVEFNNLSLPRIQSYHAFRF